MKIKPMLAASNPAVEVLAKLRYPVYASPKLDGVRGFNYEGVIYSRNLKPLANTLLQEAFGTSRYLGLDGEFIAGEPTHPKVFSNTASVVGSGSKPIDSVKFWVFDNIDCNPATPYWKRLQGLQEDERMQLVPLVLIGNETELLAYEEQQLELGYEGLILRDPEGRYKYGRSTLNEGILLKLKRFEDDEAVVIGFEEKMHNANEKTLVRNGKAARSSHKAGLVPLGTLGAVIVRWGDVVFNIGSGFDHVEAQEIWDNQDKYMGRTLTFKYFNYGIKDAPRHPVFKGWREGGI